MILDSIVAEKVREVAELKSPRTSLFHALSEPGLSVIAEIKKASPSRGIICEHFDPQHQMEVYEKGGAAAVSVLTDRTFFQGSGFILRELRDKAQLPLLRKDFLIEPIQVDESYFLGADAVLLIARILEGPGLRNMLERVYSLGMEALVEIHNEDDLHLVLETPAKIIGINNRDLEDFKVDLSVSERLIREMERLGARGEKRIVSESGIASREQAARLEDAGVDGILVGESLMRSPDPAGLIAVLKGS
ncbi:MAG: indole-3-glycerol phosphate synthase TrpC [Synergistales bacterium]|nr:indole-3-glycerol phosphate synthase TrpC [Synergistales bacterium]